MTSSFIYLLVSNGFILSIFPFSIYSYIPFFSLAHLLSFFFFFPSFYNFFFLSTSVHFSFFHFICLSFHFLPFFFNFIYSLLYFLHSFHHASILDAALINNHGYQSCPLLEQYTSNINKFCRGI